MQTYYQYELKMAPLNIGAFSIILIGFIITRIFLPFPDFNISFFLILILSFFVHEILHSIGFMLGKNTKWENITYGIKLEKGIFYCMCKQEIPKKTILISLLFPLFWIGILPYIIAIIFHFPLFAYLAVANISGAIGDIVMTFAILKMPKEMKYLDLDDATSFHIITVKPLKQSHFLGLSLRKTGKYDNKLMYAKEKKKIDISKPSYLVLIIVIICLLLIL